MTQTRFNGKTGAGGKITAEKNATKRRAPINPVTESLRMLDNPDLGKKMREEITAFLISATHNIARTHLRLTTSVNGKPPIIDLNTPEGQEYLKVVTPHLKPAMVNAFPAKVEQKAIVETRLVIESKEDADLLNSAIDTVVGT